MYAYLVSDGCGNGEGTVLNKHCQCATEHDTSILMKVGIRRVVTSRMEHAVGR